jgi:phenylalanyl-tRNA synthetase beta chain
MQFSESWLRTLANPDLDSAQLAHTLTMAGLEVEETAAVAPPFSGIVVARITAAVPHPDADRLRVCTVDDGSGEPLQIVCGAPNAAPGMLAPLARIGAVLPGDFKIKKARMRGVDSFGMLCSARELGMSDDHSGLLALPAELQPGQDIRAALKLDDTLFTLKLTPNRADCLSLLGVAREVSALTGAPLQRPQSAAVPAAIPDRLPVKVLAPDLCGRFAGRVIKGVNARAATPAWMVERLEKSGQRSISALVDISNYIMLELGRPTHVFDLSKISAGLEVRWAREGEQIELLNGQTLAVSPDVGAIASAGELVSLAGIMGGEGSAVTLDTTSIYIEAAFWWPEAIMGRARRYKFSSEASHRFERGVDFEGQAADLERMTALILQVCGGQAGPLDDQVVRLPERKQVSMRLARCQRVLGLPISQAQVSDIFTRLGLAHVWQGETTAVQSPSYRFDINIEEDLIEEVARVYGFENIPAAPPLAPAVMRAQPEGQRAAHGLRAALAARDYQEVINFSFVEEAWEQDYAGNAQPIRLLNPIASQMSVMRSSLIAGLVANIRYNAQRQQTRVRVFELGRVFARDAGVSDGALTVQGVAQPLRLAAAAWGPALDEQWAAPRRLVDFYDLKNDLESLLGGQAGALRCEAAAHPALHPGRSAQVWLGPNAVGWLGELHPRLTQQAELSSAPVVFELDVAALLPQPLARPQTLSRQPLVQRDLAIWVDDAVSYQSLRDTLAQTIAADAALAIVQDVALFDVWRDAARTDGRKSLALRFWLQDARATLADSDVEQCMQRLLNALVQTHGVSLRT